MLFFRNQGFHSFPLIFRTSSCLAGHSSIPIPNSNTCTALIFFNDCQWCVFHGYLASMDLSASSRPWSVLCETFAFSTATTSSGFAFDDNHHSRRQPLEHNFSLYFGLTEDGT